MKRYWVRFYLSGTDDYRPIHFPPLPEVLGWWCTAYADDANAICAVVEAESVSHVESILNDKWIGSPSEQLRICFVDEKPSDWTPFGSGRFTAEHWMEKLRKDFENVSSDSQTG